MNLSLTPVQQVDQAFLYIFGISALLLLAITVAMIYFVVHYRRSRHPVPEDIRGNWKLELLWTIIPTIIALSMFAVGWSSYTGLRTAPEDALEIETTGEMYVWVFTYDNGKESEAELVVPYGKAIKLNVTSLDVLHSLFIPAFRIKVDAVSGMKTYVWFYADRLGEFDIECTEYCGIGHSYMTAKLRIVPEAEFEEWLAVENDQDNIEETDHDESKEHD